MAGFFKGKPETGIADEIYAQSSTVINNQWDFYFDDWQAVKFKVIDVSIPAKKFTSETHNTGEKYYTGFTPEDEFSITFREDGDLNVLKYFSEWQNEFYNEYGEFVSMPSGTQKGSAGDKIHKTGSFVLNQFVPKGRKKNQLMNLLVLPLPFKYTPQVIGRIRSVGEFLTGNSSILKPPHFKKPASRPDFLPNNQEIVILTIKFLNMKYLGIEPLDFDYTDGHAITYSASFVMDEMVVDIRKGKTESLGSNSQAKSSAS